jgi:hypothetical protein
MKGACNQTRKQRQFNTLHTKHHAYKIVQTIVYFQSSSFSALVLNSTLVYESLAVVDIVAGSGHLFRH